MPSAKIPASEIHPELRFTRLGAALREHAAEPGDIGGLARAAVSSPRDQPLDLMPLHALRDALQENPEHPLTAKFNWQGLPEKVALDRDLRDEIEHENGSPQHREDVRDEYFLDDWRPSGQLGSVLENVRHRLLHRHPWATRQDISDSARRLYNQTWQRHHHHNVALGQPPQGVAEHADRVHDDLTNDREGPQSKFVFPDDPERYARKPEPPSPVADQVRGTRLEHHLRAVQREFGTGEDTARLLSKAVGHAPPPVPKNGRDHYLGGLVHAALSGQGVYRGGTDVFRLIGDRLREHAAAEPPAPTPQSRKRQARAAQLANGYNWHRAAAGLETDSYLADLIRTNVSARHHADPRFFRRFAATYSLAHAGRPHPEGVDDAYKKFWTAARELVGKKLRRELGVAVTGEGVNDTVNRALHRLAYREQDREDVAKAEGRDAPRHFDYLPSSRATHRYNPERFRRAGGPRRYNREAFERNIDADPLDATNHLVYADWLDENGGHDEAAFRRAVGNWMRKLHEHRDRTEGAEIHRPVKPTARNRSRVETKFPWVYPSSYLLHLEGVGYADTPTWNHGDFVGEGRAFFRPDGTGYWPQDPTHATHDATGKRYATYRNMEEALRRAFMANRKANPESPEKMDRRRSGPPARYAGILDKIRTFFGPKRSAPRTQYDGILHRGVTPAGGLDPDGLPRAMAERSAIARALQEIGHDSADPAELRRLVHKYTAMAATLARVVPDHPVVRHYAEAARKLNAPAVVEAERGEAGRYMTVPATGGGADLARAAVPLVRFVNRLAHRFHGDPLLNRRPDEFQAANLPLETPDPPQVDPGEAVATVAVPRAADLPPLPVARRPLKPTPTVSESDTTGDPAVPLADRPKGKRPPLFAPNRHYQFVADRLAAGHDWPAVLDALKRERGLHPLAAGAVVRGFRALKKKPEGERPLVFARRPKANDPRASEEFRNFIDAIRETKWEQDPRGPSWPLKKPAPLDLMAHQALSDWLRDHTGNADDPRALVVQHQVPTRNDYETRTPDGKEFIYPAGNRTAQSLGVPAQSAPVYATGHRRANGLVFVPHYRADNRSEYYPAVTWTVPVPARRTAFGGDGERGRVNRGDYHTFRALLTPDQLHHLIDHLPQPHQDEWRQMAHAYGWHRPEPTKMARPDSPTRYAATPADRPDFLDALRRVRSDNQRALRTAAKVIAEKLGLEPTDTVDVVHDSPAGARPGVAMAIYGNAHPDTLSYGAAWLGLQNRLPGVAVFHPGDDGPDSLYRLRVPGTGDEVRHKLDRAGIATRLLVPHRAGFDVLVTDRGRRLAGAVSAFARGNGLTYEHSPGRLMAMGARDPAEARAKFREAIMQYENGQGGTDADAGPKRMARPGRPVKYMTYGHADFLRKMLRDREDHTPALVYADWLEEHGQPEAAEVIRHHNNRDHSSYAWHGGSLNTGIGPALRGKPPGTFHAYFEPHQDDPGRHLLILEQKTGLRSPGTMYWSMRDLSAEDATRIADGIAKGGGVVTNHPAESAGPKKMARRGRPYFRGRPELLNHFAHVLDHPTDETAIRGLADHLGESGYGEHPAVQSLLGWVNGGPWEPVVASLRGTPHHVHGSTPEGIEAGRGRISIRPPTRWLWGGPYRSADIPDVETVRRLPQFERVYGARNWDRTEFRAGAGHTRDGRPRQPSSDDIRKTRRKATTAQVVHELFEAGGVPNLIHAVIGSYHFHPDRAGLKDRTGEVRFATSRRGQPLRYGLSDRWYAAENRLNDYLGRKLGAAVRPAERWAATLAAKLKNRIRPPEPRPAPAMAPLADGTRKAPARPPAPAAPAPSAARPTATPDAGDLHARIAAHPGVRKIGLTPQVLGRMNPDAVHQIASQLGLANGQPTPATAGATPPAAAPAATPTPGRPWYDKVGVHPVLPRPKPPVPTLPPQEEAAYQAWKAAPDDFGGGVRQPHHEMFANLVRQKGRLAAERAAGGQKTYDVSRVAGAAKPAAGTPFSFTPVKSGAGNRYVLVGHHDDAGKLLGQGVFGYDELAGHAAAGHDWLREHLKTLPRGTPRARYARKPAAKAEPAPKTDTPPRPVLEHLWPGERREVGGRRKAAFDAAVSQVLGNRPGPILTADELSALAHVGRVNAGEYADAGEALRKLFDHPAVRRHVDPTAMRDAWASLSAILSAQTPWKEHTEGATRVLADWFAAGRPSDPAAVARFANSLSGVQNISTQKRLGIARVLTALAADPRGFRFDPTLVSLPGTGKTPNFGAAFARPDAFPVDTWMTRATAPTGHNPAKLLDAGQFEDYENKAWDISRAKDENTRAFRKKQKTKAQFEAERARLDGLRAGLDAGHPFGQLLAAQSKMMGREADRAAYKAAGSEVGGKLGLEPRAMQESVWSGILGAATGKRLLGPNGRADVGRTQAAGAVRAAWDVRGVLADPDNREHLGRMGIDGRHVDRVFDDYAAAQAKRMPRHGLILAPPKSLAGAYADAVARIPPTPESQTAKAIIDEMRRHLKMRRGGPRRGSARPTRLVPRRPGRATSP